MTTSLLPRSISTLENTCGAFLMPSPEVSVSEFPGAIGKIVALILRL